MRDGNLAKSADDANGPHLICLSGTDVIDALIFQVIAFLDQTNRFVNAVDARSEEHTSELQSLFTALI